MQGMLVIAECTLQEANSTLYEQKAAHHATHMEVLAGKASRVLDGMLGWSWQDFTEFRKELDWELQAFSRANAELELPGTLMDKRHAAHLCAEKVDAQRIMRDRSWRESCGTTSTDGSRPRDLGWIITSPSAQRRVGAGQPARSAGRLCH